MLKAVFVEQTGDPSVLVYKNHEISKPSSGEVLISHTAIGLNFIDTYFRSGLYPAPSLPFIPGNEAAGIVEEVGAEVTNFKVGDRIAYAGPLGSYAHKRTIDASKIVKIPDSISDEIAASVMLKGMTARYLVKESYAIQAGDNVLYHAAAGGVGQIFTQWAKYLGATVIGTVGSDKKAEIARSLGCDHVINYQTEDFVQRVADITNNVGVEAVYDSVGKDSFPTSLDCLRLRGTWISFGQSSGPLPDFNLSILSQKGSLRCTRPSLFHYIETPERLAENARDLFEVIAAGHVKISSPTVYALADAKQAHEDLENRKTTGSVILKP